MFYSKNDRSFKPLIATSLACVFCAIQLNAHIVTASDTLSSANISDISDISGGKVGLYLDSISNKNDFVVTLAENVAIDPVVNDNGNAYGILVRTSSLTQFVSTNFQTITTKNVRGSEGSETYVYKNLSTKNVQFLSTGIVAGEISRNDCTFGVLSNLDDARYDFGLSTSLGANSQGQNSANGASAYGVIVEKNATFEGNLSFSSILGGNISDHNKSGGDAIGIMGGNNATLNLDDFGVSFGRLQAGVNNQGKDGSVIGIYTNGNFTIKSSAGKDAKIDLSSIVAGDQTFIIKNSGVGVLSLAGGIDIAYSAKGTVIGNATISDTLGGTYAFGLGTAKNVGTQIVATDATPIIGVEFAPESKVNSTITLGGVLGVSGGNAVSAGSGGNATAFTLDATNSTAILKIDQSLVLQTIGGNATKGTRLVNIGGEVVGLDFRGNETNEITLRGGNISLILKSGVGDDGKTSANTFAFRNTGKVIFENGASLSTLNSLEERVNIDGYYGIYNRSAASYIFGSSTEFNITPAAGNAYGVILSSKMDIQSGKADFNIQSTTANASGIVVDQGVATLSVDGDITFRISTNGASGKSTGILLKNSTFTLNGGGVLKLQVGDTQNKESYGIRLENGKYYGGFTFDGTNSYIKSGDNGVSYGIYTSGISEIDASLISFSNTGLSSGSNGQIYTLYNTGQLTLKKTAKIVQGVDASNGKKINLYSGIGSALNVVLDENSTTLFKADTAIGGTGDVNLVLEKNAAAKFDGLDIAIATSGNTNITMKSGSALVFENAAFDANGVIDFSILGTKNKGAKILFGSDAGEIDKIEGEYGVFLLAGEDQNALKRRFDSRSLKTRTLTIKNMNLNHSGFVLAAKGGTTESDRIIIENTNHSSQTPINNDIYIVVDKYATDSKNVVTLATVASGSEDRVIFNSLTQDDQETNTAIYQGFSKGLIKIKRESDGQGGAKYTSTLQAGESIINPDFISPTAAALSSSITLFSANLNSLNKRMGELRDNYFIHGLWGRVFSGEQSSDFGAKQSMVYTTFQAGYDYEFSLEEGENFLGAAFSYSHGIGNQTNPAFKIAPPPIDIVVAGTSSSDVSGIELAVYNSYISQNGLYSDSIVKLGFYSSQINIQNQIQSYNTDNFAFSISQEVGYKFVLGENQEWLITPQGEVSYGFMQGSSFTQYAQSGESMNSKQDDISLLRSRIGVAWGYDFDHLLTQDDFKASIYLGTYYMYDYFVGGDTTLSTFVNGKNVSYQYNAYKGSGRFALNLGTNIDIKENAKIYFDFEKSFGGKIQTDYQVSLGVRFGLGKKATIIKQKEEKTNHNYIKKQQKQQANRK